MKQSVMLLCALLSSSCATGVETSPPDWTGDASTHRDAGADARPADASTSDASGRTFDPCAAQPKPGYDPASRGLVACCTSGAAHCVPSNDVQPSLAKQL